MKWRKRRDPEIAPDEIFLDASNVPGFDCSRFEGRLEKPLSYELFIYLSCAIALLFFVLIVRTWNIQITNGAEFASESAHNVLEPKILFASRGVITDLYGVVLAENVENPDGLTGQFDIRRNYPFPFLGPIIGYVSYPKKDSSGAYYDTNEIGLAGLEAEYDSFLAGKNGQLLVETDALGNIRSEGVLIPTESGRTLRLSIDMDLENHFARAIADTVRDQGFIAGAGVIMDVTTGEVRALVSYPYYDPNVMSDGSPSEIINGYNTNSGHPFLDHVVQGVYTPGSIVKPFVAAGALTDGTITTSTTINDPGYLSLPDPYHPGKTFIYKGWKALGAVDVRKAIAWSSDIFFYSVGGGFGLQKGMGIERLDYWYKQFGLGNKTNIDLPGEADGLIPTPEWKKEVFNESWYLGDTYFTAIGQYSVQVTPIQMVRAIAAVANDGKLFTPTLITGVTPAYTTVSVDASALAVVREGMRASVTGALANAINFPFVSVAAKTGTAQTGTRNQYDNSWVEGFFPYENPKYAFVVVLERGPSGTGEQAVNVMRDLFNFLHADNSPILAL